MKRNLYLISIPIVIILCFAGLTFINNQKPQYDFEYESIPSMGDENAPVKIVEFGDYRCSGCGYFAFNVLPEIQKKYIDTGKVEFHFMNYPFLAPDSFMIAEFAETVYQELGNEAFWEFNELLFLNQQNPSFQGEQFLAQLLGEFASEDDTKKVIDAFNESKYVDHVNEHLKLAKERRVTGTPVVFVNGVQVDKSEYKQVEKAIKKALKNEKK